ncbi:hypothetical protein [Rhodopseudomonas palustris]|uniref:hypothetical protein n=1 Tax=Rhodopseudomonas palustris TaxID=1076 RepID=UPI0012EDCF2A
MTELQLMEKGQWSSTAMSNCLHDDDAGEPDAQLKRISRRGQAPSRRPKSERLPE